MNPQSPKLYGLIKLHKINTPIRPIGSYVKQLISSILEHTKFKFNFSITNSKDLISKIANLGIPLNSKLISFDVTNLYEYSTSRGNRFNCSYARPKLY